MRDRSSAGARPIRCAIYTRKSTDEGLEQDFNSLDAQREACAAYIISQKHEGWTAVPDIYDDGGYSGGTMERPALKALLADIALGKVDVIVVYKVDRLTRSLADFAKIVEILDSRNASFVSITQAFNTTSSMGRLTLNVLLSFAQFEREVTGERIRDKIAASKAKGMWMGGIVPLGYRIDERRLLIDPEEAAIVRHIFTRYLELGSGIALVRELAADGIRSKLGTNRHGKRFGGHVLSRGAVYAILRNRLYIGEVRHRDKHYPGQHEALIDLTVFEQVQQQLAEARLERRSGTIADHPSLLAGLLYDGHGRRMSPSHASRASRRYRYYRSQTESDAQGHPCWRISAPDIETLVCRTLATEIQSAVTKRIAAGDLTGDAIERLQQRGAELVRLIEPTHHPSRLLIGQLVRRIDINERQVSMTVDLQGSLPTFDTSEHKILSETIAFVRSGKTVRLIVPPHNDDREPSPFLLKLIVQAFAARRSMEAGASLEAVAADAKYSAEYMAALLRIAYLSPTIVSAIFQGTQPPALSRRDLIRAARLPLSWKEQEQLFGFV